MNTRRAIATTMVLTALLSACGQRQQPAAEAEVETTETEAETATPADGGVTREVVTAPTPPKPAPAQAVIQSQPGPEGTQLDLIRAAVTGDILTVTMRCSSDQRYNSKNFDVSAISVIDDATAQRIGVLKDNAGNWMASNVNQNRVSVGCGSQPGVLWAKFPAPPPTSQTISITLPEVAPFDGVPVTR